MHFAVFTMFALFAKVATFALFAGGTNEFLPLEKINRKHFSAENAVLAGY